MLGAGRFGTDYRRRLADSIRRKNRPVVNKYGIPVQALVAGARGGSRLTLTPGATGPEYERLAYSLGAGPGSMVEEMMPQTIAGGVAKIRGNVRRTGTPGLDELRPLLASLSVFAGNMKDNWVNARTDPFMRGYTRAPGLFAGRAGSKEGDFLKEGSEKWLARQRKNDEKAFADAWRAYSGGKSLDDFYQEAVVSPDGVVNFTGEAQGFIEAMEGTAAAAGAFNYFGWGLGKVTGMGLKAGLTPVIKASLRAAGTAPGRLGRGGLAATTVGLRSGGVPQQAARRTQDDRVKDVFELESSRTESSIIPEPISVHEITPEMARENALIDALALQTERQAKDQGIPMTEISDVIRERAYGGKFDMFRLDQDTGEYVMDLNSFALSDEGIKRQALKTLRDGMKRQEKYGVKIDDVPYKTWEDIPDWFVERIRRDYSGAHRVQDAAGRVMSHLGLTLDHDEALRRGGPNTLEGLVGMQGRHNFRKGDRPK